LSRAARRHSSPSPSRARPLTHTGPRSLALPLRTVFEQHGAIEASHYFGPLRSTLESFVAPQMREAGVSACKFLDSMLSNMAPE
jgi:hypothetical protein